MRVDKEKLKEIMNGREGEHGSALSYYATFQPDMEIVELLLKGADVQKAFNNSPLDWIIQFCEPNLDTMITLLLKYKFYGLHLRKAEEFRTLVEIIKMVRHETKQSILKSLKQHKFVPTTEQIEILKEQRNAEVRGIWESTFGFPIS